MAHIETIEQAVHRLDAAGEVHDRTVYKAHGDEQRIARADFHHLRRVRSARRQVRFNAGLPDLEQTVLGTTGSPELLRKYQTLSEHIGTLAGQPVINIEHLRTVDDTNVVSQALVGTIEGSLSPWAGFIRGRPPHRDYRSGSPNQGTGIIVRATDLTRYHLSHSDSTSWHAMPDPNDAIHVAYIGLHEEEDRVRDPENDVSIQDNIANGSVILGVEAIRQSQYFEAGLQEILALSGVELSLNSAQ